MTQRFTATVHCREDSAARGEHAIGRISFEFDGCEPQKDLDGSVETHVRLAMDFVLPDGRFVGKIGLEVPK